MRPARKLLPVFICALLSTGTALVLVPTGCSSSNDDNDAGTNGDEDGVNADDDNDQKTMVLKFGGLLSVDQQEAGLQLDMDAAEDNTFGIAYFKQATDTQSCSSEANCTEEPPTSSEWRCYSGQCTPVCTEPILGDDEVPVESEFVRYAWFDGTDWNHEDVTRISSVMLSGISMRFAGTTPTISFLGGQGGRQVCGGTDVMVGRKTGTGTWDLSAAVVTSNEAAAGADCPKMQSICDFGDVVGLWPSIAVAPDGRVAIAYRDIHNGYTKDAQDCSDLELTTSSGGGWSHQWIDLGRGSGLFNSLAFDQDGQPAIAFYNGKYGVLTFDRLKDGSFVGTNECSSNADCPDGLDCINSTGWCWNVVARPERAMPAESISMQVAPDGTILIAYYDPDKKNLKIAYSSDGISWTTGTIDSNGSTGMYPSLVIDPTTQMPLVAYYRCSDYKPGDTFCNHNQDGPRLAVFRGQWPDELTEQNKWKKNQDLIDTSDSDATDGQHIKVAITPDGHIGIAYNYAWVDPSDGSSHQAVMFRLGTWQEE